MSVRLVGTFLIAFMATAAQAATTIDFDLKGIFSEQGANNAAFGAGPGNVLVGKSGTLPPTRNYFIFDMAAVGEPIYSAQLVVEIPFGGFRSPQDSETFALYDVTSNLAILQNQFSVSPSVYVDLGSGTSYGTREVLEEEQFMDVVVDLNGDAIADMNAARTGGGLFAIGGALTTLAGGQENLFGFSNNSHRAQLVLNDQPPLPQTVELAPVVDALATLAGGSFIVSDGQNSINTQRIPEIDLDRRGIIEFDISSIPEGSTVTAASLELSINAITQSVGEFPEPLFYGYTGDGGATPADATETANLLLEADPIPSTGIRSFDFDPAFFQSLLGTSDYVGLLIEGSANGKQMGFWTTEAASFALPPSLTLTFTPPGGSMPLAGDYNENGVVDAADYVVWRENLGGGSLPNEGASIGAVDQEDYNYWRRHFGESLAGNGGGPLDTAAALPEPGAWFLAVLATGIVLLENCPRFRRGIDRQSHSGNTARPATRSCSAIMATA